jgi:hypothetical protein
VSFSRRRPSEASLRQADRRRRDDEAQRLLSVVPALATLRIRLTEHRPTGPIVESVHIRPVSVPHAPARFEFPCMDAACEDGGHEVTSMIIKALGQGLETFEGEHPCRGRVGNVDCQRILRFTIEASFRR